MSRVNTWDKIRHWHLVLPPSRPSAYHLSIIRREIQNISETLPVAVLGSTPEFRDLLFQQGFQQIYVLDKSKLVYSKMSRLRSSSNSENLVLGDWVDTLPAHMGSFRLILSDLTSGNIEYERQPDFYAQIAHALHDDGLFIDKILTHHGPKRSLRELKLKYSELPVNLVSINHFSCEFLFCSELLDLNEIVDTTLFYEILHRECQTDTLRRLLAESPKITPFDCIWYYGRDWDRVSQHYYSYLDPLRIYEEEPSSPYHRNLKIIISRRRLIERA